MTNILLGCRCFRDPSDVQLACKHNNRCRLSQISLISLVVRNWLNSMLLFQTENWNFCSLWDALMIDLFMFEASVGTNKRKLTWYVTACTLVQCLSENVCRTVFSFLLVLKALSDSFTYKSINFTEKPRSIRQSDQIKQALCWGAKFLATVTLSA